jgi:NAD-dependent deacetylase
MNEETTMPGVGDSLTQSIEALPADIAGALARRFDSIVVFSGAGMSADSGIPTFRSGSNSLWSEFNPGELATPDAWRRDKETVWAWYEWRRGLVMRAEPNPGHIAVARLQREFGAAVVTQNVDDLHERAGATGVLHLHGNLLAARCFACGEPHALGEPPQTPLPRLQPPRCARCGGYVRPGVAWFGEDLPHDVLRQAKVFIKGGDLLLVVGSSGMVQPAADLVNLAPKSATIVEVNPDPSPSSGRHRWRLAATAAQGLPMVCDALTRYAALNGAAP